MAKKYSDPLLLTLNMMLGAGIFVLSVTSVNKYGTSSIINWFTAGLIALLLSFVFRSGARFSKKGDVHDLMAKTYGKDMVKMLDWIYWLGSAFVVSAISFIVSRFMVKTYSLSPDLINPLAITLVITSYVFEVMKGSNLRYFMKLTVFLKLAIIIAFLIIASQSITALEFSKGVSVEPIGLVLAFWAFMGFENMSLKSSKKYLSALQSSTIIGMTVVFTLIVASVAAIPAEVVSESLTLVDLMFSYLSAEALSVLVVFFVLIMLSVGAATVRNTHDRIKTKYSMASQALLAVMGIFIYRNFVNMVLASAYLYIFYYFAVSILVLHYSFKDKKQRFSFEAALGVLVLISLFKGLQIASFLTIVAGIISGRAYALKS